MASLKEIKTRIASVNSTRKITSAMKMVASSKLHHAQVAIQNMLPYETLLEHILKSFLVSTPDAQSLYADPHKSVKRVALVVYSSNSSLCGGYNANVLRLMEQVVKEYRNQNVEVTLYPIGRKVEERVDRDGYTKAGSFMELAEKPNAAQCRDIARTLSELYRKGEIDKVELIYHHFKSAGTQILVRSDRDLSQNMVTAKAQEYLRKKREAEGGQVKEVKPLNDDFIVEPDLPTVITKLVPKLLDLMIYTALLDSNASEHAARMVAMQAATDNADDLLHDLNLEYNKSRQAAITSELLDIVGGSVNN